jgi:hypothetical protein
MSGIHVLRVTLDEVGPLLRRDISELASFEV